MGFDFNNFTWVNWLVFGGSIVAVLILATFVAFLLKIYRLSPGIVGLAFDFVAITLVLSNALASSWQFSGALWTNPLWLLFLSFGVIFGLFAVSENEQRIFGYISIAVPVAVMMTFLVIMYTRAY
jgi:hypothetical protein